MDASTRPNDTACLPHPYTFADHMRTHWERLGNVYSPALGRLWLKMGETFNAAIAGNPATADPFRDNAEVDAKWHVLSPPCGAGKTQGLRVYAAMLAKANLDLPPDQKVGTLIVVREIETADELAGQINATWTKLMGGRTSKEEGVHIEVQPLFLPPQLSPDIPRLGPRWRRSGPFRLWSLCRRPPTSRPSTA